MTSDHAADIDKHVRIYITVFVALMALTIVTVAISRFHLPVPIAVTVALLVATVKGSLVACYFMHLISEKKLIYAVLALTAVFFVALLALPVMTVTTATGFTDEPRSVHARADPPLRGARGAVRLWCLGLYGREDGVASLLAAVAAFARVVGPGRLRLVVPAQDEDAAMTRLRSSPSRVVLRRTGRASARQEAPSRRPSAGFRRLARRRRP